MHIVWVLLPLATVLIDGLSAFNAGADGSMWEVNWQSLSQADQARIAGASRSRESRAELAEQGELDLAEGFNRREHRRRSCVQLPLFLLIVAVLVFTLVGVLPETDLDQLFPMVAVLILVAVRLRDWQIKRLYRKPDDPETGRA